jgi:hypothetical protein
LGRTRKGRDEEGKRRGREETRKGRDEEGKRRGREETRENILAYKLHFLSRFRRGSNPPDKAEDCFHISEIATVGLEDRKTKLLRPIVSLI